MRTLTRPGVLFSVLLLFAPASNARACSQCMCGTPFPADVLGGVVPMELRYGFEERYLSKSNGLDEGPGIEQEREHRISPFVLWRAHDRIALLARLPYNLKELRVTTAGDPTQIETSGGLGDAEVLALVGLTHTAGAHPLTVGLVIGGALPTGSNNLRDDAGQRRDAHLQPGTGAWSGTAGLNAAIALRVGAVAMSILGRANGGNAHGYRYGDVLLFNAGYTSPARNGWRLLAQMNGRSARRDRFEDGTLGGNTGGTVIYAAPGALWEIGDGLALEGAVQIPVYKSLFGEQDEHTTGRLAVTFSR